MSSVSKNNIRAIREANGLSLEQLASSVGISKGYLSVLENNMSKNPSYRIIFNLASRLGVSIYELLGEVFAKNDQIITIPLFLQQLAVERNARNKPIPQEHLKSLASFDLDGRRPRSKEDYELLYEVSLRLCKPAGGK